MIIESYNDCDVAIIESGEHIFEVNIYDKYKEIFETVAIATAEWHLSRYGESESLLYKTSDDESDSSIQINKNIITITLTTNETANLSGKFNHQLTVTDEHGRQFVIDLGQITIRPLIQ